MSDHCKPDKTCCDGFALSRTYSPGHNWTHPAQTPAMLPADLMGPLSCKVVRHFCLVQPESDTAVGTR